MVFAENLDSRTEHSPVFAGRGAALSAQRHDPGQLVPGGQGVGMILAEEKRGAGPDELPVGGLGRVQVFSSLAATAGELAAGHH